MSLLNHSKVLVFMWTARDKSRNLAQVTCLTSVLQFPRL